MSERRSSDSVALPPRFDAAYYVAAHPELGLTAEGAADHHDRIGRAKGLVASPLALRENLIAMIDDGRSVLEIGPFCAPLLRGPNIAYLDILDAEQLRQRAMQIGRDPAGCPAWIDYVGGLEQVRRRFDALVSSHAIEHQPDLVHHLQQAERVLEPDGLFCLIIPDKRYCLDHHIAESSIAEVLQAHRDQRRVHMLRSVIEHQALTTHNDPRRHWEGDHGPAMRPDRRDMLRRAQAEHDLGDSAYIDVHAWYFTPDSFAAIIADLEGLGLTGFEVAGVYDSVLGRNEFCAVLRLTPAARERARSRASGGDIIVLQTADAERYAPMLAITAPNVREYCRRHHLGYESFVGVKRGFHPWQATFNRIPMLADLLERGFRGWALYLDADAWIQDLDFDLAAYLADKRDRAAIFATSGVTGEHWDVNAGVALVNLGHELGRTLVRAWAEAFAGHSDEDLRAGAEWFGAGNDQDLLHRILRRDAAIAEAVLVEPMAFMNGPHARFIRQQLRTLSASFEDRLEDIAKAVADIFRGDGHVRPARASAAEDRWSARLAHSDAAQPPLIEAPVPAPRSDFIPAISAAWRGSGGEAADDPAWRELLAALQGDDDESAAAQLAALGRSTFAQGFFGGARQHERAWDRKFAGRLARWTYDKLLSLAEAVGVVRVENPENGPWGFNARAAPAELFAGISAALGADLSPPTHVGGHLGIAAGEGIILHMRMLDAIHAAWRLRQIGEGLGLGTSIRIAELGGGAGFTALYARRLGLREYRIYDSPIMNIVQGYVLAGLNNAGVIAAPEKGWAAAPAGSVDLLLNADSWTEMEEPRVIEQLQAAARAGVTNILSINPEADLPGRNPVRELVRKAGGYRLAGRHRHWLRAGYVEELFLAC